MTENRETSLLNAVYKNSRMAYDSTGQVLSHCEDAELCDYLKRQRALYAKSFSSAKSLLRTEGKEPKQPNVVGQLMSQAGIFVKTLRDKSRSNIALIMYNGTNMGIADIAHSVNSLPDRSGSAARLASELLCEEEKFADGLRKFL